MKGEYISWIPIMYEKKAIGYVVTDDFMGFVQKLKQNNDVTR